MGGGWETGVFGWGRGHRGKISSENTSIIRKTPLNPTNPQQFGRSIGGLA